MKKQYTAAAALSALMMCGMADAGVSIPMPDAEPVATDTGSDWDFEFVPYLWAAGLKGSTGQQPFVSDIDLGFSDLAENLDFAISGAFNANHKSGWGVFLDGQYIKLSGGNSIPTVVPGVNRSLEAEIENAFFTFAPTYRFYQGERGGLQTYLGGRVMYSAVEMNFAGGVPPIRSPRTVDIDDTWIDAVIGLQGRWRITEKLFFAGVIDVGGGSSDLTWQTLIGLGYQFTDHIDARIAYRYMSVDYESDGFVYDIETQGLALGLGISW